MHTDARIILVNARNPLNIGSVARGMANFGFHDLALVTPYAPAWREARSAVGAEELLKKARIFPSLQKAVQDCTFVFGTTTGQRRSLAFDTVSLPELGGFIESKLAGRVKEKLALVFGSEKTGLLNEHFAFCHAALTVPTDRKTPSLNLSHAVTVCCYELARRNASSAKNKKEQEPPRLAEVERVTEKLLKLYLLSDFQKGASTEVKREWIRRIFLELNLNRARLLQAGTLLERIIGKLEEKK